MWIWRAAFSSFCFIAFKLLALIRDKVFGALRRLCPAKLEGKDKGNLISIITSDIELLDVFYAHTISPIAIAFLFCIIMVCFIGSYHAVLGILALAAYITVGVIIPLVTSRLSGDDGIRFRSKSGELKCRLFHKALDQTDNVHDPAHIARYIINQPLCC